MNIFKKTVRIFSYVVIGLGFAGLVVCCCHSDKLMITKYTLKNSKIEKDSFKAAIISDYHHRELKFNNTNLIDEINSLDSDTDAIFILGDLIDQHVKTLDDVNKIIDACYSKTPDRIYFVTGNHEEYAPLWPQLQIAFAGKVKYLDNKMDSLTFQNKKVCLYGLKDPRFDLHSYKNGTIDYGKSEEYLNAFNIDPNNINILLAHRPELVDLYAKYNFDYIFCGHTHGGQIRIGKWTPLNLVSKGQKTYPRGEYKINNSTMIVSAGLGYSAMFPLRINCNPEIVTVTITK